MQRPIITTDVTGCANIIDHGQNGILVPKQDAHSIKLALKLLILNPELGRKFGIAIRKKVIKYFSSNLVNSQTLDLYKKIIN